MKFVLLINIQLLTIANSFLRNIAEHEISLLINMKMLKKLYNSGPGIKSKCSVTNQFYLGMIAWVDTLIYCFRMFIHPNT